MVITQVAKSVPFNNSINGFTATNTQEAIEEAKLNINSLTLKAIPVSADLLIIEDSADSFNQKKIEVSNLLNDFKLKVSSNDTTEGYLENKIVVSDGSNSANILEVFTLNDGLDEDLRIQIDETKIDHDNLLNTHNLSTDIDHTAISNIGMNSHADIDTKLSALEAVNTDSKNPTGFENTTDSTISFVDGTRTFTISPAVVSFSFYIKGVKYTKTTNQTVVIPETEGLHYIYFDNTGTLQSTDTFSNELITDYALVSILYWDDTNKIHIIFEDERHGMIMSGGTHLYLHSTFGTQYVSGLSLGSFVVDGNGDDNTHAQFNCTNGIIRDEDLKITITDGSPQDITPILQAPVFYKEGASGVWRKDAATNFPVKSFVGGDGYLAYNEFTGVTWQQTEVSNFDYVLCHIFATNDIENPIIAVQGQNEYNSIFDARDGALVEINSLILTGLPIKEWVILGTIIYQTGSFYDNDVKARIISTDDGNDYIDWRTTNLSPSVPATSHALLSDLDYIGSQHSGFERDAWESTSNPTVNNDEVDTASLGRVFQISETWINTSTNTIYMCVDNSTGAAIWQNLSISGVEENLPSFIISGNGSPIITGLQTRYLIVPFACTLTGYTIYSDVSTSTIIDVWKTTYANYDGGSTHPVNADSITASAPITITTALKTQDNILTDWTTSLSKDDILAFNIDSNDNATVLTIVFHTIRN